MASPTVVFITGASRGIGKALTKAYLSLPDHTVVAALRTTKSPQADQLRALSVAPGTQLHLVAIENTSSTDPNAAIARLTSTDGGGITHIDIVIANSAISIGGGPLDSVDPKDLTESFNTNAVSNLILFSAARALLERSSEPKWIAVSTRPFYPYAAAYGMSKAAQNWFTQALHAGNPSLIAFAVHPGFVATDMGIGAAKGAGIALPETSPEQSAKNIIRLIDAATRECSSGKFFDADTGEEIPW
ncbi:Norsolorinic acid keto [Cyphellophora attinorum]|uniref:Norsolorinic acid keto n=1 Tax=Cyphellophora attinorum TaxID=1664694 RepID=A0A0N0NI42_9EURO|nr:Norsolorinic acid keto [Phialophora attinorum]KPI35009.1 Norsolorinic acid keto [Phialophora attinorum]